MRVTIKLGHIAGIALGLHWSVVVIAALIAQMLATSLLPAGAPGWPVGGYWAAAIIAVIGFFAALLAHEFAHALTARHFGLRVRRITLWLLGGVAELDGQSPHARGELMIAAAGPLTSLAAAVVFGGLAVAGSVLGAGDLAIVALTWLALINFVLAVFNLLPGAPLDGGRVLAAAVWWGTGNRATGQRVAARGGVTVGLLLVAGGTLEVLLSQAWDGLWLVLLGWFLVTAARAEAADTLWNTKLGDVRVQDAMTTPATCGYAQQTVDGFVTSIARYRPHHSYPVLGLDGLLTGMVTISRLAGVAPASRDTVRLGALQTPRERLTVVHPDTLLAVAARTLQASGHRLAVVTVDGHVCGVLSLADIVRTIELAAVDARPARQPAFATPNP